MLLLGFVMGQKFKEWLWTVKHHRKKILLAILFLAIAIYLTNLSGDYVSEIASTSTSHDLILDNIGPYNLSFIFVWLAPLVILAGLIYIVVIKPAELYYTLSMTSLFLVVRSGFVIFTHLRPPADAINVVYPWFLQFLNVHNDLFFSGHTGMPFLAFLIFREHHKGIAYFMLACSILLGVTVLLMHVHYSIDVFSAFFITYGIYKVGNVFIRR